jgi:Flagellar biosynthesis protein, FliO
VFRPDFQQPCGQVLFHRITLLRGGVSLISQGRARLPALAAFSPLFVWTAAYFRRQDFALPRNSLKNKIEVSGGEQECRRMKDWIATYVGAESAQMVSYGLMGLAGLIGLWILYWLVKKLRHGTFISGGRNALPRLAVQDATPVDSHRRLVLVRRDDVEHLLLIGGNTDIVVEQNIRHGVPAQRSAPEPVLRERPMAEPAPRQMPPLQPMPQRAAPMPPPARPAPPPVFRQEARLDPLMPAQLAGNAAPAVQPAPSRFEQRAPLEPVERPLPPSFSQNAERPASRPAEPNLDDELEKMIGEFDVFSQPKQ